MARPRKSDSRRTASGQSNTKSSVAASRRVMPIASWSTVSTLGHRCTSSSDTSSRSLSLRSRDCTTASLTNTGSSPGSSSSTSRRPTSAASPESKYSSTARLHASLNAGTPWPLATPAPLAPPPVDAGAPAASGVSRADHAVSSSHRRASCTACMTLSYCSFALGLSRHRSARLSVTLRMPLAIWLWLISPVREKRASSDSAAARAPGGAPIARCSDCLTSS
mmetsp:Transcript_8763/g.26577  ORF Transcript_8763/g.26577 Transcript_8763/m.26577 type:complete len:222 (+) Transcript_8763:1079-1744(+)